jgi:hypothetical protein
MISSLTITQMVWSYQELMKVKHFTGDNVRDIWGLENQFVTNETTESAQNYASDADDDKNHWMWFPSKKAYWTLTQVEAALQSSPFLLPCTISSFSSDILPIHLGGIKYFHNESDAGDRCQIDDSGGGSLTCSRFSYWDDKKKSYVCGKIYHQSVHRHLFGLHKLV